MNKNRCYLRVVPVFAFMVYGVLMCDFMGHMKKT